jgi:hypothetical protein
LIVATPSPFGALPACAPDEVATLAASGLLCEVHASYLRNTRFIPELTGDFRVRAKEIP